MLLLALAGCLPDERQQSGEQLFQGRGLSFFSRASLAPDPDNAQDQPWLGGKAWLLFDQLQQQAEPPRGAVTDLHAVAVTDREHRILVRGRTEGANGVWPARSDGPVFYFMRNERTVRSGGAARQVATLSRMTFDGALLEEIPDVSSFAVIGDGSFSYSRETGEATPPLHFRDGNGRERIFEKVVSAALSPRGAGWIIAGDERTLYRLQSLEAPLEPMRTGVSGYTVVDGTHILMTVPVAGRATAVVFDLPTRSERVVPAGDRVCCWLSAGPIFVYAEAANGDKPARRHVLDINTDEHTVMDLPRGMADLVREVAIPNQTRSLWVDSAGRISLVDPDATPKVRLVDRKLFNPVFSRDGETVYSLELTSVAPTPEGNLLAQDTRFFGSPLRLNPEGSAVSYDFDRPSYFPVRDDDTLAFWAHYGRSASDLFFADRRTAALQPIVRRIRSVSVGPTEVFGIINISEQDLTGDLVRHDVLTGVDQVFGRSVDAYLNPPSPPGVTALIVKNRVASSQDGLWITRTSPPTP